MFKTLEQCRIELVAHTTMLPVEIPNDDGEKLGLFEPDADWMPCSAARASFGNEDKTGDNPAADKKLMHYLADHQHMTPFEYQHATLLIEVPLFIRSQIHRHRTFSFNEISRRYTSEELEFWIPDKFRGQATNNKQASSDEVIEEYIALTDNESIPTGEHPSLSYKRMHEAMHNYYVSLLASGVSREQARAALPQSLITRFYMGGVLRNWAHFIQLRRDPHAQYEVQVVANRIAGKLRELWPESCDALNI